MKRSMVHPVSLFAFASMLVLAGCAEPQDSVAQKQADAKAVTKAVEKLWQEYSASLNAGDLNRWLSLWTNDGIQMPPYEAPVVGKKKIRKRNQKVLDRFEFDISVTNEEVETTGDWAYSRGVYKGTLIPRDEGGAAIQLDGKYMTILQRQADGDWKIYRDIFNSNVAPTN